LKEQQMKLDDKTWFSRLKV